MYHSLLIYELYYIILLKCKNFSLFWADFLKEFADL